MAITTTLQTRYVIRSIGMSIACIVLGLWGVYDYAVKIPREQERYARLETSQAMKTLLETSSSSVDYTEKKETATTLVTAALERSRDYLKDAYTEEELASEASGMQLDGEMIGEVGKDGQLQWFVCLTVYAASLQAPAPLSTANLGEVHANALAISLNAISALDGVTKVGAFDRATQWAFIACLPFAVYMFWQFTRERRRVWTLEDNGTLKGPEGTFSADEIVDIDMAKWMSKSIAKVKTTGGTVVVLDDYVFRHIDEIVGPLAHRFYPDEWTAEAKQHVEETEADEAPDDEAPEEDFAMEADVHGDERNN